MIIWTSVLTLGLGAAATMTLLDPPPDLQSLTRTTQEPVVRSPASDTSADAGSTSPPKYIAVSLDEANTHQAVDLTPGCHPLETAKFTKGVRQLRLNGDACKRDTPLTDAKVVNLTNGFSATTFLLSPLTFTTDYISLAEGDNRLMITHTYKDGSRSEHELRVHRAPASLGK